jgi:hypothetical protein
VWDVELQVGNDLRREWSLAVLSVVEEGFFAIMSVMSPDCSFSSVGWTGILSVFGLWIDKTDGAVWLVLGES